MTQIRFALDWTPNALHAPVLIAARAGFYSDAGLDVIVISPEVDAYETTPAKKLVSGEVDLAICPSESVISYAEGTTRSGASSSARLQAVLALLDRDASSILCSSAAGIVRPRDLDGKVYGSYNARYEDEIVRAMIRNDGGKGDITIARDTEKLDLYKVLTLPAAGKMEKSGHVTQHIDATWIFSPVEGIKYKQDGFSGVEFRMEDYGIPYGYAPVVARKSGDGLPDETVCRFIAATQKGYQFAIDRHEEAVGFLSTWCPDEPKDFLSQSLAEVKTFWRSDGQYGRMEREKWSEFLTFLSERQLLGRTIEVDGLFMPFDSA